MEGLTLFSATFAGNIKSNFFKIQSLYFTCINESQNNNNQIIYLFFYHLITQFFRGCLLPLQLGLQRFGLIHQKSNTAPQIRFSMSIVTISIRYLNIKACLNYLHVTQV